jgi:hypothetical protein
MVCFRYITEKVLHKDDSNDDDDNNPYAEGGSE